ncbi:MAG: hypothetical protein JWN60_2770 [Acidobacteria bacterium]|jgi:hypothetical protein|nr:hypothetical protein [Acidobacteriota bacterium]
MQNKRFFFHSPFNIIHSPLNTCFSESTMPIIVQSVGVLSRLNGKLASLPRHQKTSSPTPAPTESSATSGFPFGDKSAFKVCTIKNLRPSSASFLTVDTRFPITRANCIFIEPNPQAVYSALLISKESITPIIAESTGQSLLPSAKRADDPATTKTFS